MGANQGTVKAACHRVLLTCATAKNAPVQAFSRGLRCHADARTHATEATKQTELTLSC